MKNLKFNRKRIAICICFLFIIILSIISVQAFSFREQTRVVSRYPDLPSSSAVPYLVGALQYQLDINPMGRVSYLQVVYVVKNGSSYEIYATLTKLESSASISVSISGDMVTYSFGVSSEFGYNDQAGFFEIRSTPAATLTVDSKYILYSDYTVPATSIPSFSGFNPNASYGSSNFNSFDVYSYFEYIYNSAVYREERESTIRQEAQSEGESIGFEEGAEAGYFHGYDIGYADGLDEGEANGIEVGKEIGYETGYESGYADGLDDGYDTGYSDGYKRGEDIGFESGYSEGYSDGYETGYNIVYDDLQQPGTIQAIFTTKDSSGNILYLAQEVDIANLDYNYKFLPYDQLSNSYVGYRLYIKTYDVTKYLENNPLDFDYPLPVLEDNGTDFLALYRKVNVTREYIDLYRIYSIVEVTIDQSFIDQLNNQYNEGLNDANALVNGIGDIATKPIVSLKDALDFEIFGLNIGVVAVGIVAILFAIWAYNKIRKILPI